MTRFVTGGAGFIGANYLFYLRAHYPDDRLVCIDKLTYAGNLSTLAPLLGQPNFRFARVDICDREAVYGLFEDEQARCGRELRGREPRGPLDRRPVAVSADEYYRHVRAHGCLP